MKRSKITAQQLQREAKEAERFRAPLTGKRARHIAGASAHAEYDPVLRSINAERRGSVKRQKQEGKWYGQMADEIRSRAAQGTANAQAVGAAIGQQIAASGAQDTAHLQDLAAHDAAFANLVGGPTNPGGLATATAMAGSRRQQAIALNAPTVAGAASRANQLGGMATATRMRGHEAQAAEKSRREKIAEDFRAGLKQRGQAYVKNLNDLREGAVKSHQTDLAFGLERSEAGEKRRHDRATEATSAQSAATSAQQAATAAQKAQREEEEFGYEKKHGTGTVNSKSSNPNKKGPTQSQKYSNHREYKDAVATAQSTLKRLQQAGKPINAKTWSKIEQLLIVDGIGGVNAHKAVEALRKHYTSSRGSGGNPLAPVGW